MKNRILIVAAHPDDEILGCGGTVARLVSDGAEAITLILGEGATSRDDKRNRRKRLDEITNLKQHIKNANLCLGITDVISYDFPDNRFDTVALLEIIKVIEKIKIEFKPNIIFTHFANDMNIDHYITNRAVLTASRPIMEESVTDIYAFEVLSSTEWNFPLSFSPDYYVKIDDTIKKKLIAMSKYKSELRVYPHPRSLRAIEINAEYWGMRTGTGRAEAFQTVRKIWK